MESLILKLMGECSFHLQEDSLEQMGREIGFRFVGRLESGKSQFV